MKVYTYFDSCIFSDIAKETLKLWEKSWAARGWEPIILSEKDAEGHPFYSCFRESIKNFPSVNGHNFDYHAFMRWLAIANLKNSFIVSTEPDVINYALNTNQVTKTGHEVEIHSPVPAFLIGSSAEFERFCAHILTHNINNNDVFEGKPHLSDQDFAARYAEPRNLVKFITNSSLCSEVFSARWELAPCVHFGTTYMAQRGFMPKHKYIPKLREK
jgi:hypothetical protein